MTATAPRCRRSALCVPEHGARTACGEQARSPSRERRRHARSRPTAGCGRSPRAAERPTTSRRARGRSRAARTGQVEAPPRGPRDLPRLGARLPSGREQRWRTRRRHRERQAADAACGRRAWRSRHHELAKLFDGRRPDPGHGVQLLDRPKCPVRDAVVEDLLTRTAQPSGWVVVSTRTFYPSDYSAWAPTPAMRQGLKAGSVDQAARNGVAASALVT